MSSVIWRRGGILPIVSIIVPVYKVEKYIEECISSILEQTFTDFELILVNDGSPDRSGQICDELALKDNRIRVIHVENGGVSSARNIGIENARGQYIQFVDSDDTMDRTMTEKLVGNIVKYKSNIVICGYKLLKNDIVQNREYDLDKSVCLMDKKVFFGNIGYFLCDLNYTNPPWNKLYCREIIESNKIRFNKNISYGEDLLFNLAYFDKCNSYIILFENLYNYMFRDTQNSLETSFKREMYENQMQLYQAVVELIKQYDVYTKNNKLYLSTYLANRVVYCLKMLVHKDNNYNDIERKGIIIKMVNNEEVRNSYDNLLWGLSYELETLPKFIKAKDVNSILSLILENKSNGKYRIIILIEKTLKNLRQYGILNTLHKIKNKILKRR